MLHGIVIFVLLVWPVESKVAPINEDDPEIYVAWSTPSDPLSWPRYSPLAKYTGNLFAGRSEFPWILDIRSQNTDAEEWGIGNLLTGFHVLTTARVLLFLVDFEKYSKGASVSFEREAELLNQEFNGVNINYCGNYLWEDYQFNSKENNLFHRDADIFFNDVKDAGTRYPRYMFRHPLWKRDIAINGDVGIIRLAYPIRPLPPTIDLMPFWYAVDEGTVSQTDLSQMHKQRRMCYVGSYGRGWANRKHLATTVDYKLKYRVYYMDLSECTRALPNYRPNAPDETLTYDPEDPNGDKRNLWCFGTRASVGAICDHDRGAPLICDGRVYGFVVRGANYTFCNNVIPLPFLVQKGTILNDYYSSIISHVFHFGARPKGAKSRILPNYFMLYIFSFLASFKFHL